jgi:hypothetical protein
MTITCGIDWAERHHDVTLVDAGHDDGTVVAQQRIDIGTTGFTELVGLIAEHAQDPSGVPVAIETDNCLLSAGWLAPGSARTRSTPVRWRYRERYAQAGAAATSTIAEVVPWSTSRSSPRAPTRTRAVSSKSTSSSSCGPTSSCPVTSALAGDAALVVDRVDNDATHAPVSLTSAAPACGGCCVGAALERRPAARDRAASGRVVAVTKGGNESRMAHSSKKL